MLERRHKDGRESSPSRSSDNAALSIENRYQNPTQQVDQFIHKNSKLL